MLPESLPAAGCVADFAGQEYLPLASGVDQVFEQVHSEIGVVTVAGGLDERYRVLNFECHLRSVQRLLADLQMQFSNHSAGLEERTEVVVLLFWQRDWNGTRQPPERKWTEVGHRDRGGVRGDAASWLVGPLQLASAE